MKKLKRIIVFLVLCCCLLFSNVYALTSNNESENQESEVTTEEYLPPIEDDTDDEPYDEVEYERTYNQGGTYYWYEIWGKRLAIATVIIVIIVFGIKLAKKNNEVKENDFYEE